MIKLACFLGFDIDHRFLPFAPTMFPMPQGQHPLCCRVALYTLLIFVFFLEPDRKLF